MAICSQCGKLSAALTILLVSIAAFAAEPPAAPKAAEKAPAKPKVLVTISKETTFITEPLRSDGYPDYIAALNQRCSQGVTPENNAAVLLWKAMGPKEIKQEDRKKYFLMLGVLPLPEKGNYFVTYNDFANLHKSEFQGPENENNTWEHEHSRQFTILMQRPWSRQEFPVWAKWIDQNEKARAILIQASKRPRYYTPFFGDMLINSIPIDSITLAREAARGLVACAMFRLHEGETAEAWENLLACHRLARLVGQGPTLIEALVAITIDGMASTGDRALLEHGKLSSAEISKMRADLAKLRPMPKMVDKIDTPERFFFLDCVVMMAREGPSKISGFLAYDFSPKKTKSSMDSLIDSVGAAVIDWDLILRMVNSWYDRFHDACRKPTRAEQKKALACIDEDIKKLSKSLKDPASLGFSMFVTPNKAVSERVGQFLVTFFLPTLSATMNAEDRSTMQIELNDLAFALAAYHADHGSYPAKLADLSPKYVAKIPKDLFNDADLNYRQEGNGYLLYSVGANGQDDGGLTFSEFKADGSPGDDLVVRVPAVVSP